MFGNDNYTGVSAYHSHSHKHVPKNGVSLALSNKQPFQGFGQANNVANKMPRPLLPKSETAPTGLESQIANLWKSNNSDSYVSSDDIWKFCPSSNMISDYSSFSSASQSPEDHSETFFNVASQLQRQTPPDLTRKCMDFDYGKLLESANDHKEFKSAQNADNMIKNSLCCQFILMNQCDRGANCVFAHSIMQIGQPIL